MRSVHDMKEFKVDKLSVVIAESNSEMGGIAAKAIAADLIRLGKEKSEIRVMFAAAPSQNSMFEALGYEAGIPWEKIVAFHMDEYVGISIDRPQSFRLFLKKAVFDRKPFKAVNLIEGDSRDIEATVRDYERKLLERPMDMIVLGIGENGHIAFNDPDVADFNDNHMVKIVELDDVCRQQQVNDGCFSAFDDVPKRAVTVTIPAFRQAGVLHCMVPNSRKAKAVKEALCGPVTERCPASILRTHDNAHLYLDAESASLL